MTTAGLVRFYVTHHASVMRPQPAPSDVDRAYHEELARVRALSHRDRGRVLVVFRAYRRDVLRAAAYERAAQEVAS